MKYSEFKKRLAANPAIGTLAKASGVMTFVANILKVAIKKDGRISIPGLGVFKIATRKARKGRNPKTGETLKIKAKKVLKFKAAKNFLK